MRKAEQLYHKHGNDYYKTQFLIAIQAKCNLVTPAKCTYYRSKISDCKNDSSNLNVLLYGRFGK